MSDVREFLVLGRHGQLAMDLAELLGTRARVAGRAECDLALPLTKVSEALQRLVNETAPRVVINAAAYTAVDKAETEREAAFHLNGQVPGVLARICASAGVPLLHYSTDYVFDGEKSEPWTEDDPVRPLNAYGESKRAGEEAVLAAGGASYIFRTTWIYGRHGANFLKTMVRLAREREELRVVDDQFGAPTTSLALARASLDVAQQVAGAARLAQPTNATHATPQPGIYHLAAGGRTTWHGLASRIVASLAAQEKIPCRTVTAISTADFPTPARRPKNSVLAQSKFARAFGLTMPSWDDQFEEVWQFFSKG